MCDFSLTQTTVAPGQQYWTCCADSARTLSGSYTDHERGTSPRNRKGRFAQIALKNPQNAPAPNSSIWAATLGISAGCALKARRTAAGGRLSANAGSPAKIFTKGLSGLYNCDRVENPS